MKDELLTIKEAAAFFGVSTRTLIRWEEKGVLKSMRTVGNQRRYSKQHLANLFKVPENTLSAQTSPQIQVVPETPNELPNPAGFSGNNAEEDKPSLNKPLLGGTVAGVAMLGVIIFGILSFPQLGQTLGAATDWLRSPETSRTLADSRQQQVLAATDLKHNYQLQVNVPSIFKMPASFLDTVSIKKQLTAAGGIKTNNSDINAGTGKITASNVVYSLLAGTNVSISGDPQNPTISAAGGVTTLQGLTGALTLTNGTGIGVSGLEVTNTDPGSGQNIFKVITAGGTNINAGSNTDQLTFAAGSGITISGDAGSKTVTITSNAAGVLSGLTTDGVLYATSATTATSTDAGTNGYILKSNGPGNAPTWELPGTVLGAVPFTNISSGTNTSAAMIVGSGASLGFTGTGTINASTLNGATFASPGAIGGTTPGTGAFTTLTGSTFNGLTVTNNGTNTLTIATGKTFTVSNTLSLAGTDGTSFTFPSTSGTVVTTDATQTLTNKTIAAGSNTITGLTNANLSGTAGITNGNLANSSVTVNTGTGLSGGGAVSLGGTLNLTNTGVTSAAAGTGISIDQATGAVTITNNGVTSLTGTANQVNVSASTGSITLSLPQNIHTGASPTFAGLTLSALTTNGGVLYTNGTGTVTQTGAGTNTQCLLGGTTPTWGSCATGTTNFFQRNGTTLSPATTGDSLLLADSGTTSAFRLEVNGKQTGKALAVFNETGNQDIFTASASGVTRFTIANNGNVTATGALSASNFSGSSSGTNTGDVSLAGQNYLSIGGQTITANAINLSGSHVTSTLGIGNGGTGLTSTPTNGQLLIGNGSGYSLAAITPGTAIGVSNGSGTITINNNGVTSLAGTTNQVNVSGATGSVTLSLPQDIHSGASPTFAGLTLSALTNNGGLLYTNGSGTVAQSSVGSLGQCLTSAGGGAPTWSTCAAGANLWQTNSGTVSPFSNTLDLLVGGTSTASAKFAFINNTGSGTPTASISAGTTGGVYLSADGKLATTAKQTLTLGDGNTGNLVIGTNRVVISGFGSGIIHSNASGVLTSSAVDLATSDVTGTLSVARGGTGTGTAFTQGSVVFAGASGIYSQDNSNFFFDDTLNRFGVGVNSNLSAALDVRATSGTAPSASISGNTSFAGLVVDQSGSGDLFTASKSGATKFVIKNNGDVQINNLNAASCDLKADTTGLLFCGTDSTGSGTNFFTQTSGLTYLGNTTSDFAIGGTATSSADFSVAGINGAQGSLQSFATNGFSLPANRFGAPVVTGNGYMYVIGGDNASGPVSTVYYAKLNSDGSAGSFSTTTALPGNRSNSQAIVANGYVYVAGGDDGSASSTSVFYAKINGDGTLGSWANATSLVVGVESFAMVTANGYIYAVGGDNGTSGIDEIYYAKLNANGTIGSWVTQSNIITQARMEHTAVIANGYMYVIGGDTNGVSAEDTIYYARLNSDGSVGTFSSTTVLPAGREYHSSVVANGYLYVMGGGTTESSTVSTVYFAKFNSDGTVGSWSTNTYSLPAVRNKMSSLIANGYVYVVGGSSNGSNAQSTVYYASTARVSMLANLDLIGLQGGSLASASANGSFGSLGGSIFAGNIFSNGNLQIAGNTQLWNGLSVNGNQTFNGDLSLTGGSGTTPAASFSATTSFAGMVVDQSGAGDLFTASKSGATKFVIKNNGDVQINNLNAASCDLKADTTGLLFCGTDSTGSGTNFFTQTSGLTYLGNTTSDFAVGGTASSSAKFAVLGVNSGTPTASVSAGLAGGAYMTATGTIATTNNQTLTLGSSTTGNIKFNNYTDCVLTTDSSGNLQCGGTGGSITIRKSADESVSSSTVMQDDNELQFSIGANETWVFTIDANVLVGTTNFKYQITAPSGATCNISNFSFDYQASGGNDTVDSGCGVSINGGSNGAPNPDEYYIHVSVVNGANAGTMKFQWAQLNTSNGTVTVKAGSTLTASKTGGQGAGSGWADDGSVVRLVGTTDSVGIGTNSPLGTLDVRGNSGTTPVASFSGTTAKAAVFVDNSGAGDLFTASKSGAMKFTIKNSGDIQIANFTANGGLLYTNGTGTVAQTSVGSAGQCLTSAGGGAPTWGTCGSATNYWQLNSGTVSPFSNTLDLLLGGTATTSAKFAFYNVNSGVPTASISANSGNNATFLTGDGNLGTTNAQTLTIGGSATGNIILSPKNGTGTVTVNGSLLPGADDTHDLGSTGARWRDLYLAGDTLHLGTSLTDEATFGYNTSTNVLNFGTDSTTNGDIAFYTDDLYLDKSAGSVGINTTTPGAALDVRAASGTTPAASIAGTTAKAALFVDNSGAGDIFTASKSGATKFVIKNNGDIQINNLSNCSNLTTDASGILQCGTAPTANSAVFTDTTSDTLLGIGSNLWDGTQPNITPTSSSNNVLVAVTVKIDATSDDGNYNRFTLRRSTNGSNATCSSTQVGGTFGSYTTHALGFTEANMTIIDTPGTTNNVRYTVCDDSESSGTGSTSGSTPDIRVSVLEIGATGGSSNNWDVTNGAIMPKLASTLDFLLGSTASSSAEFSVLGINAGTNPTASVSATSGGNAGNGISLAGDGSIQSLRNNTLLIGGNTTGNIQFKPGNSATSLMLHSNGAVGIGTTSLTSENSKLIIAASDEQLALLNGNGNRWNFANWDTTNSLYLQYNASNRLILSNNGSLLLASGVGGTTNINATLDVRGNSATTPVASFSGSTNFAASLVDQSGAGDIFTASKSGATKFVIKNNGDVQINNLANCTTLATDANGVLQCSGIGKGVTFTDTTQDTINSGTGGIDVWDGTYPNFTPTTSTNTLLVAVNLYIKEPGAGETNQYENDVFTIRRTTDGSAPTCSSTQVGNKFTTYIDSDIGQGKGSITGTFLDSPGTTNIVRYTVCTDSDTDTEPGDDFDNTVEDIRFTIVQLGADLAENYYTTDTSLEPGHIVSIDSSLPAGAKKSTKVYDNTVLGIYSTAPGHVLDDKIGAGFGRPIPVALSGRVPVKVTTENGPIEVGDYITSSSLFGVGMKATHAGRVVGQAMTAYSGEGVGAVLVFVNNTWYFGPETEINDEGDIGIFAKGSGDLLNINDIPVIPPVEFEVKDSDGQTINKTGVFSNIVTGKLRSGFIQTQDLAVTGTITAKSIVLNGTDLSERLAALEDEVSASSDELTASVSALQNQQQTHDNSLSTLSDRVASFEATLNLFASGSALLGNGSTGNSSFASAQELGLDKLDVKDATVSNTLTVIGRTLLSDVGITGKVNIGLLNIQGLDGGDSGDTFASINTSAGPLKLQSDGYNGIDLVKGHVTIDTAGNVKAKGEITAKKINIDTKDVLGASLGEGTLPAGKTKATIETSAVTKDSKIFVTARTATNLPLSVTSQKDGDSFTVEITAPAGKDIRFNWWIVN